MRVGDATEAGGAASNDGRSRDSKSTLRERGDGESNARAGDPLPTGRALPSEDIDESMGVRSGDDLGRDEEDKEVTDEEEVVEELYGDIESLSDRERLEGLATCTIFGAVL